MKSTIAILLQMLLFLHAGAQEKYDVASIPANLLKNAAVVIREEETVYEVKNLGSAVMYCQAALTILNKNGESASNMHEFYNRLSSISDLKASLYDASGKKIRDYKSADFTDRSVASEGTMFQDDRIKYLEFTSNQFPYTIAYSYRVDYKGIRTYPDWKPVKSWGTAVENSAYVIRMPDDMTFKYLKSEGLSTDSVKAKNKTEYRWSCSNISALEYEPLSTGFSRNSPWVMLAPNKFEYDNSKANIENWVSLGAWMQELSKGMQELPETVKTRILSLVSGARNDKEKIMLLYRYLQANTRYVGIQLGIGGYKPAAAEKVSLVSYGDCKGLSNYMKAMLQAAGIHSDLVVIGNGMPSLNTRFASVNQANHMILCVPSQNDTTWLECTSPYVPPGYIGNGNSDRTVLLITENGGKLARTPRYVPEMNYQKRQVKVALAGEGNSSVSIDTRYGHAQFEEKLGMLTLGPAEKNKRVIQNLGIPGVQVSKIEYAQQDKDRPEITEQIELRAPQLLTRGGDRLFLVLNMLNREETALVPVTDRKTPFRVSYSYLDEDEITYTIPKDYKIEFLPENVRIISEFGEYTVGVTAKGDQLIYKRHMMVNSREYPPEKYNDYVAFRKKIYQADKQKGILVRSE
ncbi:DUF3857 domain-containing protein [Pedobacter sp. JY14-1]|uniref:DUF3857 domain-containing protein n=1 Tax=Pedobacter sp. JY14-1 TaxID=3034151 RepID=UPI0023E2EC13|nr:DUF3857 domain-containing protein [Pedobacter sp. JY14-1]